MARKKTSWWRRLWRRKRPAEVVEPQHTPPAPRPMIEGFVERLEPTMLRGWVICREEDTRPGMVLTIDGSDHPLTVLAMEREDVANSHGMEHLHAGFRCELPDALALSLRDALREERHVQVRCGGTVLPILSMARIAGQALRPEPLALRHAASAQGVTLESWGHFLIRGRSPGKALTLRCNASQVDCAIVKRTARGAAPESGAFELELPGHLWESAGAGDACIELLAGGEPVLAEPITLSRSHTAAWITDIARMPDDADRQYFALLALEHTHFGGLWELLEPEARELLTDLARTMNLSEYLHRSEGAELLPEEFPGGASTLLVWAAMREFNRRLCERPGAVFEHVEAIAREQQLDGVARRRFLTTTIPLLCRSGELGKLRSLVDFAPLYSHELSDSHWELSMATALLAADGLFARVADILWRIGKKRSDDWLNTECIAYALERAQALELAGELGMKEAEALRYAFIGLLDSFKGDWFSRLFDASLIRGMVGILAAASHHTDWQQRDAVDAAIRHYGLCPDFWEAVSGREVLPARPEFARARAAFRRVEDALRAEAIPAAERIESSREALAYLLRKKNPDAASCLRELFARDVVENSGHPSAVACALAAELQAIDLPEAIRIAAFPGLADEALDRIPGTRDRVLGAIRQVSERPGSPMYAAQCTAYTAWEAARAAVDSGQAAAIEAALQRLAEYGFALANPQGACLGADLLAELWSFERQCGRSGDVWLERLGELVRGAIEALEPRPLLLPAAICSALERVASAAEGAYPQAFLAEMRALVRKHFGSRHEALFQPSGPAGLRSPAWPRDTLVVVYSCRKYLDTRVRAIRETWLRDLDSRGIPWLIAVGDGEGEREADGVLGLRVPDSYEALPRKTLALVEWVHANTRARYLLKIDDDCYLDVARYFSTLSYRKHHYYGRIIRRPVGGTDRLWHQAKSQGELARKAIDKSPEPSVYADGGGAYSLSRTAMGALLQMSRSERGLRLAGASFMEDKLVGDLLAMAQIEPSAEDYESCQRRRSFPEAEPVAMWENTFFPSRITPVKVVHLDTDRDQAKARELGAGATLWPRKLWPSYRGVALNGWSNQLELLSEPGRALALARHSPRVVAVMRNERLMLPHFLAHYRAQGVRCFLIVDNCSDDGTREYLLQEREDVVLLSADAQYKDSRYGVAWQQAVLANLGGDGWSVLADADELLVYPDCESRPLGDFVAEVEAEGADAVLTYLVDMYPYGSMREADFSRGRPFEVAGYFERHPFLEWKVGRGLYGNATHHLSALRHRLAHPAEPHAFTSQKKALLRYRPWMRFSQGIHDVANARMAMQTAAFAHFKYHAAFEAKIRTEIQRRQHFNNAEEYRRYANMLSELREGFGTGEDSQRYGGSQSFAEAGLFGTASGSAARQTP